MNKPLSELTEEELIDLEWTISERLSAAEELVIELEEVMDDIQAELDRRDDEDS